ncbi:MAG: hypothetical protein J6386_25770 [Candidatus Synoicihabitans palmerolidicus]|nr:hypothetical protein [Candidatus Synoicihabitans palmerolidicus]MCC5025907.1 hypothetical protein [Candidatus Synoicihabitans palmerolidicus]MCC5025987.1 hypothetical protein [Candidatus Synoicihabitans palmerolidicus]
MWLSILTPQALPSASFTSADQLTKAIDSFIAAYNDRAVPFRSLPLDQGSRRTKNHQQVITLT